MIKNIRGLALTAMVVLLGACGEESPSTPQNQPPSVSSGGDRSVSSSSNVTLNGSASDSDGTIASYQWTQVGDNNLTLSSSSSSNTSFTAPDVTTATAYTLRLTVTDDDGATQSDDIIITVNPLSVEPQNQPPVVNAGSDQSVVSESSISFNATATDDGTITSYQWNQIGGSDIALENSTQLQAGFTAPLVSTDTSYQFRLTVADNEGATSSDDVNITVSPKVAPPLQRVVRYEPTSPVQSLPRPPLEKTY